MKMTTAIIFDVIIVILLIGGALAGFRKGVIKAAADFICTLAAIVLAFFLKNPLSVLLYTNLPFFKFGGIYEGISVLNIIIYELIAYLIVLCILLSIAKIILKVTGIVEKIIDATLVLTLPSKLLGLVFGLIESYLVIFIILFSLNHIPNVTFLATESNIGHVILEKTPILSNQLSDTFKSIDEIYEVAKEYKEDPNKKEANTKAFEILIKNKVLTKENANKLIENGKINIDNAKEIINKY